MTAVECVKRFVDALNRTGISYMVVGSFSSNIYGLPRSTKDADFVIEAADNAIAALAKQAAPEFILDPQATFEMVTATTAHRFTHHQTAFFIEIFLLSTDPHDLSRFARRVTGMLEGQPIQVPSPEDVIVTKLRWSRHAKRQKDLDDVRGILAVQSGQLDLDYIRRWADQHGTRDLFENLALEA